MSAYRIFHAADALVVLVLACFVLDALRYASDAADIAPGRRQQATPSVFSLTSFARSQPNRL